MLITVMVFVVALFFAAEGFAAPMTSASYSLAPDVVGSGGRGGSSASYLLRGATGGQPAASVSDLSATELYSGFWFLMDLHAPTSSASPGGGTYGSAQVVTLSCIDLFGAGCDEIRYTLDGSVPNGGSFLYSVPLNIATTTTLRYFATDKGGWSEDATTNIDVYTIVPDYDLDTILDNVDNCIYIANFSQTDTDTDGIGDACDNGSTGFAYLLANNGTNPPSDSLAGVRRSGPGPDGNNLTGGPPPTIPKVDIDYTFEVSFTDATGELPFVEPTLYLAHRASPTASDFFPYTMSCVGATWAAGKVCSVTLRLGPAAAHKFYFQATGTTGMVSTMPTPTTLNGPAIEMLRGYNMVAAARDITTQGLYGSDVFSSSATYRWVSTGLDTSFDVTFNGYLEQVVPGPVTEVQEGEGYYVIRPGPGAKVNDLAAYSDYSGATKEVTLAPGWNMVASPYNGNVLLGDTTVRRNAETPVSWQTAAGNGWVVSSIYYYDGSDWGYTFTPETPLFGATLVPWRAYWVYLELDDVNTYTLIIPQPSQ